MADQEITVEKTLRDTIAENIETLSKLRESLFQRQKKLGEEISAKINKAPKRSKLTEEDYQDRIDELESDISSGSYSLSEEKEKRKTIHSLQVLMNDVAHSANYQKSIEDLKKERKENDDKINETKQQIDELYQALHDAETISIIQRATGVTLKKEDITDFSLEVQPEQIKLLQDAHVNSMSITKLVNAHIMLDTKNNKVNIRGDKSGVEAAKQFLNDALNPITIVLEKNVHEIRALMNNSFKYARYFQDLFGTRIETEAVKKSISITGGQNAVSKTKDAIEKFFKLTKSIPLSQHVRRHLFSNEAVKLKELQKNSKGYINLNTSIEGKGTTYDIYGLKEDIKADEAALDDYIASVPELTFEYEVEVPNMVTYCIGIKGATSKKLSKDSGAQFEFGTKGTTSFKIIGTQEEIDAAKVLLTDLFVQYKKEHVVVSLPKNSMNMLLDNNSKLIKDIQTETKTNIYLTKATNSAEISGTEEDVKVAEEKLMAVANSFIEKSFNIASKTIYKFIGERGEAINKLRKETNVNIDVDASGKVTVIGTEENIEKCEEFINEWNHNNYFEEVVVAPVTLGSAIIGKKGDILNTISSTFNVHIQIDPNQHIEISGTPEDVSKAKQDIIDRAEKFLKENAIVSVSEDLTRHCPAFRRTEIENLEKKYENKVKIMLLYKEHAYRITGEEEAVNEVKKVLSDLVEQYKDYIVEYETRPEEHLGCLVGKSGVNLKHIQEEFNVLVQIDRNNNDKSKDNKKEDTKKKVAATKETKENNISIFGKADDVHKAKEYIKEYLANNIRMNKNINVSQKQLKFLMEDRFAAVQNIRTVTGANIEIPKDGSKTIGSVTVTIVGTQKQVEQATPLLYEVMSGRKHIKYDIPSDLLNTLMKSNGFFVERIELSCKSKIHINVDEHYIEVVADKKGIEDTYSILFENFVKYLPNQFATIQLSESAFYAAEKNNEEIQKIATENNAKIELSKKDSSIFITSFDGKIDTIKEQLVTLVDKFERECILIKVDSLYIPHIIGAQGKVINKLIDDYKCTIEVLNETNTVVVVGEEEAVKNATDAINQIIEDQKTLNYTWTVASPIISKIIGPKGATIKGLENEYKCKLSADRKTSTIHLHGDNKEAVEQCKQAVENLIGNEVVSEPIIPIVKKEKPKKIQTTEKPAEVKSEERDYPILPPGLTLPVGASKSYLKNLSKSEKKRLQNNEEQKAISSLLNENKNTTVGGSSDYYTSDAGYSLDL